MPTPMVLLPPLSFGRMAGFLQNGVLLASICTVTVLETGAVKKVAAVNVIVELPLVVPFIPKLAL